VIESRNTVRIIPTKLIAAFSLSQIPRVTLIAKD